MLRVAICDDNNVICSQVEKMVFEYEKTSYVHFEVEVFNEGEHLLNHIQTEHQFDLIFLDIELGTSSGIKVGTTIRQEFDDHISKIIFITSKNGYESQLFDIQPLNFLRKPIKSEDLTKCLDLVVKLLDVENKFFEYKQGRDTIKIRIKDILYFKKDGRKIKVVTHTGEDYFNDTLSNVKSRITKNFVQPHETFLLNYNKISSFNAKSIKMSDGKEIPISKGNLPEMRAMLINTVRET